jgi:uroporphyrinogen-III decarboxylase
MRRYLPRIFGAFEPLKNLKPLTDLLNFAGMEMASLGSPEMQEFLKKLLGASQEFGKFMDLALASDKQAWARGFIPAFRSTMAIAPFDSLGDSLRGTSSIMMDMYRQPAKLIEALEKVTEMTIHNILSSPSIEQKPTVSMPLHKGADGWMSQKQFDTFYWPYLRRVINAFINEGYLVELFAEGSYNTRLNFVNDFPKGFVNWKFDQTDMAVAKETVGKKCCIQGNVPASLMVTGTPKQVKDYCHKLINDCAPGGGYVLGMGAYTEKPKIENLFAMVEAAKEFGVY